MIIFFINNLISIMVDFSNFAASICVLSALILCACPVEGRVIYKKNMIVSQPQPQPHQPQP